MGRFMGMLDKKLKRFLDEDLHVFGLENVNIKDPDFLFRRLREVFVGVDFQVFDAEKIVGFDHVRFAVLNAFKAFKAGRNISKSFPVEVMLYVSGQRQIGKALKMVGVCRETKNIVLVVFGSGEVASKVLDEVCRMVGGKLNSGVLKVNREKIETVKKTFGISDLEIETQIFSGVGLEKAVEKLVIEKVALLATQQ